MTKYNIVGELLLRQGLLDSSALDRALLEMQSKPGVSIGKALDELGLAEESAVTSAIAKGLHLESLGSELPVITPEVDSLLSVDICHKKLVVPLSLTGNSLRLAMVDPLDYRTIQDVMFRTSKQVTAVVASQTSILALLRRSHADDVEIQEAYEMLTNVIPEGEVESAGDTDETIDVASLAKDTKLAPVIRLVNLILSKAAKEGASDIHIEPKEQYLQVRQREDGLLRDVFKVPKQLQDSTISRLKIISGMDISERRRSQDGRSQLRFQGKRVDLRVSTLPTQFGEKVVVRLLDQRRAHLTLEEVDLSSDNLRTLQSLLSSPQGMILVTGPTGSGKSSTLYTALNWLKSGTNNIITIEDPIEYQLEGINQVQINTKAGVTFAGGLRSILRQDPNVIFVGEIRDQETAGIALEAAQTGHLLVSTLHTNDAPATITRLLDLGVEPFLVASSVIGILAQRLVRKLCSSCLTPQDPSVETIAKFGGADRLPANAQWRVGRGCGECNETGFKGRVAIHEIIHINDELRELIHRRASEQEIRRVARKAGMRTLREDGVAKSARGLFTLDALLQALPVEDVPAPKQGSEDKREGIFGSTKLASEVMNIDDAVPSPTADNSSTAPSERERVLIVEDSHTIAAVVKYFLELEGFEVLSAQNGFIGLELAKQESPRVIVTDINMPDMDGMTMVKALRANAITRDIAILMLTSESSVESEMRALAIGADDYLVKPVEPRRLAARVKALLARTQGRQFAASKER
jgi:type IV pilus assembly protein PilB